MRILSNIALALVISVAAAGCCGAKLKAAATGVEAYTNVILPEYQKYVEKDPTLDENAAGISDQLKEQRKKTKAAVKDSIEGLKRFLETMKGS